MINVACSGALSRRALLGGGAAMLVAGCGRAADANRLTFWAMSTEGENAPLLLPAFERATGTKVEVQAIPWTAAHEKLLTAHAGGSLPDVIMVANTWVAELAMVGALAPVPPGALLADHFSAVRRAVTIDGRAWGVPWVADTWVQFYRTDLLGELGYAAPPPRLDEWLAMARALKRRHADRHATLMLLDWPEPLMNFAVQTGEPFLRDRDARGNFRAPGFRDALGFYKTMFDEKLAPAIVGTEVGDAFAAFARGDFAIFPSDADTLGDLARRVSLLPRAKWGVARTSGPTGPAAALVAGSSLAVTRTARNPAQAWALIRHLCARATQLEFHRLTGDLPSRPSAWRQPALARDPVAQVFAAQLGEGVAPPPVPEWARIFTEVQAVAERMVRGQFGVDAAAREMDAVVDRLLAKRRWLLSRGRLA